jgi:peptide-methionine (S)-S-oxide reductase
MGPVWGAERRFWQADGVYTTAVGHAGSHDEVVRVVFDPDRTTFDALLRLFWESHDPTQTRDLGTRPLSAIFWTSDAQRRVAEASRASYQRALAAAGFGRITTEIVEAPEFDYAEESQQQYLAKHPATHSSLGATGVPFPPGPPAST